MHELRRAFSRWRLPLQLHPAFDRRTTGRAVPYSVCKTSRCRQLVALGQFSLGRLQALDDVLCRQIQQSCCAEERLRLKCSTHHFHTAVFQPVDTGRYRLHERQPRMRRREATQCKAYQSATGVTMHWLAAISGADFNRRSKDC
jgi:hypothetical protein